MTNLFLLLFGGLQGLLLSFLCLRKKKDLAGLFFASFIMLATLQIFLKVVSKTWLMGHLTGLYKISYELPFLFGPVLYLYIYTSYHAQVSWRWKWSLHFLPFFFLAFTRGLYIYYFPHHPLLEALHPVVGWKMGLHMGLQWASLWFYGILAINIVRGAPKQAAWHSSFIWTVLAIESIIILALKLMTVYYGHYPDPRWLFLSLTLFIYWISYKLLSSSHFSEAVTSQTSKYAKSGLKKNKSHQIIQHMTQFMEEHRPYLDPDLTIDQLAKILNIPKHHLSQAINSKLHQSFGEVLNKYRIKAAKEMLTDPSKAQLTIAAIAYDAGFKSLSHFNATFKKSYTLPPSKFRQINKKKRLPDLSDR